MQHASLKHLDHRPWPLPQKPWQWRQRWLDLGFAHFPVERSTIAALIPSALEIDQHSGSAWLSIVPFRMVDVAWRSLPSVYPFSDFPELNLRTYVRHQGKPGVWFFSLDAACRPLVFGGRHLYGLPYHQATIQYQREGTSAFESTRHRGGVRFRASFCATSPEFEATRGSLEEWLTERYCFYSFFRGSLTRVEVHHAKWTLRHASMEIETNDLFAAAGIRAPSSQPLFHCSPGVDVISYSTEICTG